MSQLNIYDVAKLAGVSVSTVSRVLNNHPDVSGKTREKVQRVMDEHAYIPNDSARSLSREPIDAVGVVVKGFDNPFFHIMLGEIQARLAKKRYTMILQPIPADRDEVEAGIALVKEKKPRGLIFLGGNFEQNPKRLSMLSVPFVVTTIALGPEVDKTLYSSVAIDNYAEAYKATGMACQAGHTRIAALGILQGDKSISELRAEGFMAAMRANGLPVPPEALLVTREFSMEEGYAAAKRHIATHSGTTCFMCMADVLALGAMRAIQDAGLSVPRDYSVIGFDGIPAVRYAYPRLSTVVQPAHQMAKESVRILLARMEDGAPNEQLLYPATFYEGESFAPPHKSARLA